MNQTNPKLIFVVVSAIAVMAFTGLLAICIALFVHSYADPSILTALIALTSGLTGSLTALLVNTRTAQPTDTASTTTTTVQTTVPPPPPADSALQAAPNKAQVITTTEPKS